MRYVTRDNVALVGLSSGVAGEQPRPARYAVQMEEDLQGKKTDKMKERCQVWIERRQCRVVCI